MLLRIVAADRAPARRLATALELTGWPVSM
jgi:hypothetical protein